MAFSIVGVVFGPLLMLLVSVFLLQNKGRKILVIASGILFLFAALYQLLQPAEPLWIHIPQIIWKLLTLATAAILFLLAIRDKHYDLSALAFIQILVLILTEILLSPDEPAAFLQFDTEGKLLLPTGAFIFVILLPAVLFHPDFQRLQQGKRAKAAYTGIFLWMAAFAGMLCAGSVTGLFLFAQWGYLGNLFLRKAFGEPKKRQLVPVLQQSVMTLWVAASGFIYLNKGTPAITDLTGGGNAAGLLSALVTICVFTMGALVPEKIMTRNSFLQPVSLGGLSMVLFSLLVPFSVFLKFRSLFLHLDHRQTAPVVFLGALLMAANAYYASTTRKDEELVSHLVLFAAGWGIFSAFTGPEGLFFTVGYIMAAAFALAFLFSCVSVQNSVKLSNVAEPSHYSALSNYKTIVLLLFLVPPFSCALPGLVVIPMLEEYGLAMLLAMIGLVLVTAVIVRWALPQLRIRKTSDCEKKALPGVFRYTLPVFLILTVATSLLSGPIYRYLQSQPPAMGALPASDPGIYADLSEMILLPGLNTGSVFLGLSAILLIVLYIIDNISGRRKNHEKPTGAVTPYSLTSWLPAGIRIPVWIRAAWIAAATLLVGVALSCLKV